jgi:DNA-binding FadR family transcriptional regulator
MKLNAMGIVRIQHGRKSVVQSTNVESLILSMSHVLELTDADVVYVIEAKELMETKCARLASKYATEQDLAEIGKYLEGMKNSLYDDRMFAEFDYLFHLKIVEAAKNPILIVIIRMLSNVIRKTLEKTAELHSGRDRVYMLHRKYYGAICCRDGEKAACVLHKIEAETIKRLGHL